MLLNEQQQKTEANTLPHAMTSRRVATKRAIRKSSEIWDF